MNLEWPGPESTNLSEMVEHKPIGDIDDDLTKTLMAGHASGIGEACTMRQSLTKRHSAPAIH